jgi:hypothetical protein
MLGFDTGLFSTGKPEDLIPMVSDKLTGEQQHPARRAIPYPFTGRAHHRSLSDRTGTHVHRPL